MTRDEAWARASRLWGSDGIETVTLRPHGQFEIVLERGYLRFHRIDAAGVPVCHKGCIRLAEYYDRVGQRKLWEG